MALVFALLGILLLSMLAAALMLVTSSESQASFHYKSQTQATYAAMAGVQRTADWYRQVYGPWLNPVSGTPPAATNPPISDTTYVWNVYPPTYNGNPVKMGDGANFPDSTKVTEFGDMRTTAPANSASVGNATASYTIIDATLVSHERYKALDGITDRIIERWQVRVTGRVSSTIGEDTVVQETAIIKAAPYAIFGDAIHGQCEVQMNGTIYTDSFYSPTGLYNTPPGTNVFTGADAGASVASNSFTGSSGSSGTINGDVVFGTSPDTGCTTSGSSVSGLTIEGDLEAAPGDPFPPITPTFTTSAAKTDDCVNKSSFESPAGSGIYHYPPNAPSSNNLGDCTLTGSEMLRMEVPDGNTPAAFYIRGIDVGSTFSSVAVVHATSGLQCSNLDAIKCAPVLLYVSTTLQLGGGGLLSAIMSPPPPQCDPTRFSIFYTGTADAHLGGTSGFCGTIYAPNATLEIAGNTQIWGAVTAKNVETGGGVEVHYDLALAKMRITVSPFRIINQGRKVY